MKSNLALMTVIGIGFALLLVHDSRADQDDWPILEDETSPKVIVTFQDRAGGNAFQVHEGIDSPAPVQNKQTSDPENKVVLPRAMRFLGESFNPDDPEQDKYMDFYVGSPENPTQYYGFIHLNTVADLIQNQSYPAGTLVGYIGDAMNGETPPFPDHLHFDTSTESPEQVPILPFFAHAKHPLIEYEFPNPKKDPGEVRPAIVDRDHPLVGPNESWDDDDESFVFRTQGGTFFEDPDDKVNGMWRLWGEVDIIAEVEDDMDASQLRPGAYKVGYYITVLQANGSHDVRSSGSPYVTFEANRPLIDIPTSGGFDQARDTRVHVLYETGDRFDRGIGELGVRNFHYILTNTKGTDGSLENLDADQHWATNASGAGDFGGNGVGATVAANGAAAYFRDGKYRIHAIVWDLVGSTTQTIDVWVENFNPMVLGTFPAADQDDVKTDVTIRITFSEPMNQSATEAEVTLRKKGTSFFPPVTKSWDGNGWLLSVKPTSDLEQHTEYEVKVTANAKDLYGGPNKNGALMGTDYVWNFTTE